MTSTREDEAVRIGSEPAFPTTFESDGCQITLNGLTKREYIAAKMMATICDRYETKAAASLAVHYADALLSALTKEDSRG